MHLRERKAKSLLFCVRRGQDSNQRRKRKEEIVYNRESEEEERRRREKIVKSNGLTAGRKMSLLAVTFSNVQLNQFNF